MYMKTDAGHASLVATQLVDKAQHMKIMITGYARHGKDTVADILAKDYGMNFVSSSYLMAEKVILPKMQQAWQMYYQAPEAEEALKPEWPDYADLDECYADRIHHRQFWFEIIRDANMEDPAYLSREIFSLYDLYVGNRNPREFNAAKCAGLFDFSVWVDAGERLPAESKLSCGIEPWMNDYILDNNGSEEDLERNVHRLMATLKRKFANVN